MSESRRSAACAISSHSLCPHAAGLRLPDEVLCRCECHSGCPLAGADSVQLSTWWNSCSCGGSEALRSEGRRQWRSDRPPDLAELQRKMREQEQIRSAVRESIVARSPGLAGSALRQSYVDELLSRGEEIPPESALDREVMLMEMAIPPDAGVFTLAKGFIRSLVRVRAAALDLAAARGENRELRGPRDEPPYVVMADLSLPMLTVRLDPHASSVIQDHHRSVFVALDRYEDDRQDSVGIYLGSHRVGVLSGKSADRYRPAIQAAHRSGKVLVVQGIVAQTSDAPPEMRLYAAGIL